MNISSAQYAALLQRIDELENDNRFRSHIAALKKELDEMNKDFDLEVSKGNVPGHSNVNKYGASPSGIQTTYTDIWGRADATPTQQVWLAPTAARIHTISSSSASDVSGGTGATSVTIFYLPDWDTAETTETVAGNLNAGIAMSNAAVMINRMIVNPQSTSTTPNVGTIIATAATDATITAVILPDDGQTEQAIYGFPSGHSVYLTGWAAGIDKASGAAATCDFEMSFNPNPDVQTLSFIRKQDISVQSNGSTAIQKIYNAKPSFVGPGIIKIRAKASINDVDGHSNFNLTLVKDGY